MIHILIGTRAQLIKMMPLMHELDQRGIEYNFIFMAQHKETIYEMLNDFNLKLPDYVLCDEGTDIVSSKHMVIWSLKVLWKGLLNRKAIFQSDKSGIVLIHGDAPPLFLGAILSKLQGLKVGSVEAGLRSFNIFRPFPEEATRVFTGKFGLIDVFYCQDDTSMKNSAAYKGESIHTYGNTIIDAISLANHMNLSFSSGDLEKRNEAYAIVTLHRFETISNKDGLNKIVDLVKRISQKINVKFILHPPTRAALLKSELYEKLDKNENIELLPRLRFIDFNKLISNSQFMVTDGGSNQEESAFLGIPCLLFRNETERRDGLGVNVVLSKFDTKIIDDFLDNYTKYKVKLNTIETSPTDIIINHVTTNYET